MYERDVFLVSIANQITLEDLPTIIALVALQAAVDSNLNIIQDDIGNEEEKASALDTLRNHNSKFLASIAKSFLGTFVPNMKKDAKSVIDEFAPSYVVDIKDDGTIPEQHSMILVYSSPAAASRMDTIMAGAPTDVVSNTMVVYVVREALRCNMFRRDILVAIQKIMKIGLDEAVRVYDFTLAKIKSMPSL